MIMFYGFGGDRGANLAKTVFPERDNGSSVMISNNEGQV